MTEDGSWRLEIGCWKKLTVGSLQSSVGNWQYAVGKTITNNK